MSREGTIRQRFSGPSLRGIFGRAGSLLLPIALALVVTLLLLLLIGAPPIGSLRLLWTGAVGSPGKLADTVMAWVPLALAGAGLVVTFTAGLWNIGIEGQIVAGAVAATGVARVVPGSSAVLIPLTLAAGVVGGALWALLAGVLKTRGNVNEIFGGLGLDFVASGMAIYLIIGPWKRQGIASTSGTDLFRREAWLSTVGTTSLVPLAVALAVLAVVLVYLLMRGTMFGLRLKAVGKNVTSARLLGIPDERYLLAAFATCGALAGLAGAIQATGVQHKLIPAISGGFGFLAILVVLLAGFRAAWIAPIALFFAGVSIGATQLQLRLNLNSALGGVIQGLLVLIVILAGGWQQRWRSRRRREPEAGAEDG
ncbi:MAG TPA: ABC transporter permease [Actinomycetota bacterium]